MIGIVIDEECSFLPSRQPRQTRNRCDISPKDSSCITSHRQRPTNYSSKSDVNERRRKSDERLSHFHRKPMFPICSYRHRVFISEGMRENECLICFHWSTFWTRLLSQDCKYSRNDVRHSSMKDKEWLLWPSRVFSFFQESMLSLFIDVSLDSWHTTITFLIDCSELFLSSSIVNTVVVSWDNQFVWHKDYTLSLR
jgi:hypothetical protein